MNESISIDLVISIFIFWSIALIPPLVIRFVFIKKPVRKYSAYAFVVLFWFINLTAQYFGGLLRQEMVGGGPPKPGMIGLFLMAIATYAILRHGAVNKEKAIILNKEENINKDPKEQWKGSDKWGS